MANPLISQGQLNKLLASIVFDLYPQLNVTASNLGSDAITLALEGTATTSIQNLTGVTQSPEPYQMANATIHLLKPQQLATLYQAQFLLNSVVGDLIVYTDAAPFTPYPLINCALTGVREMTFSGRDAGYAVGITGTYYINAALYV